MVTNKKRLTAAISLMMVLVMALTLTGCGGGGASSVVNTFFDSIDKQDVDKFLSCFEEDFADEIREYADDDTIKDELETLDEMLADEFGKNWRKELKVGKAEQVDKDDDVAYYEVEVTMDDEDTTFDVIKVNGKYYLDDSALGVF